MMPDMRIKMRLPIINCSKSIAFVVVRTRSYQLCPYEEIKKFFTF